MCARTSVTKKNQYTKNVNIKPDLCIKICKIYQSVDLVKIKKETTMVI